LKREKILILKERKTHFPHKEKTGLFKNKAIPMKKQ